MRSHALPRYALLVIVGFTLLFVAGGLFYARLQNVWIDETTQLSGATLPLGRMLAWLSGAPEPSFGVPPDRMPPISYLIDAGCDHTLCARPYDFRLLHLLIAAMGVALGIWLAARRFGLAAAAVTGAMLALSPKMTELGVEIRAYPIFFTITVAQLAVLAGLIEAETITLRRLLPMLLLGVLAVYTHFFGLVSSMAIFVGLFAARAASRREAGLIAGAAAALVVLAAGLKPFIGGAAAASGDEGMSLGAGDAVLWVSRLVGHPSLMLSTLAALLFFLTLLLLLLLTVAAIVLALADKGLPARRSLPIALLVALASGLAVTLCASLVMRGFNPLKPSYSIWAYPVLALLLGAAVRDDRPIGRVAKVTALLFVAGAVWTQAIFLSRAEWFVHGPSTRVAAAIGDDPRRVAIIYHDKWALGFFPIYYRYHEGLAQWAQAPDGTIHRLRAGGAMDPQPAGAHAFDGIDRVIIADIRASSFRDLRALYAGKTDPDESPRYTGLTSDPVLQPFTAGSPQSWPGLYAVSLTPLGRNSS